MYSLCNMQTTTNELYAAKHRHLLRGAKNKEKAEEQHQSIEREYNIGKQSCSVIRRINLIRSVMCVPRELLPECLILHSPSASTHRRTKKNTHTHTCAYRLLSSYEEGEKSQLATYCISQFPTSLQHHSPA